MNSACFLKVAPAKCRPHNYATKFGGLKEKARGRVIPLVLVKRSVLLVYSEGFNMQWGPVCFAPISHRRRHQAEVITSNLGICVKEKKCSSVAVLPLKWRIAASSDDMWSQWVSARDTTGLHFTKSSPHGATWKSFEKKTNKKNKTAANNFLIRKWLVLKSVALQ